MASKAKYKKVTTQEKQSALTIEIYSDGNVIELQHIDGDVMVFKYIKSQTKLGMRLTMSKEQYEKFLITNQLFKK